MGASDSKISKKDDLPIDVECVEQTVKTVVEDPKKSSTAGGNISESTKTSAKEDEESTLPNSC
jgi:hypothetical protein